MGPSPHPPVATADRAKDVHPVDLFGPQPTDPLPQTVTVRRDADARQAVEHARRTGLDIPALELVDGDLCRSVGETPPEAESDALAEADAEASRVDVVSVLLDGRPHWFVAHLVAREPRWRDRVVAVLNTPWVGGHPAPGVDPSDGRLDVFDGLLSGAERRRLRSSRTNDRPWPARDGRWTQASTVDIELGRPTPIWLDGEEVGKAWYLSIRIEPRAARYRREHAS